MENKNADTSMIFLDNAHIENIQHDSNAHGINSYTMTLQTAKDIVFKDPQMIYPVDAYEVLIMIRRKQ